MAPPPEPVTVPRLIDRDPVDPGSQAGLATEAMDGAEDAQEHLLRQIERFVALAQQVHGELKHHALMFGDQLTSRGFVAVGTPLHERRFTPADVRPANNPCLLQGFHYTFD